MEVKYEIRMLWGESWGGDVLIVAKCLGLNKWKRKGKGTGTSICGSGGFSSMNLLNNMYEDAGRTH